MTFDIEKLLFLNNTLLCEMPRYKEQASSFDKTYSAQAQLLRSLMNVREPMPLSDDFLAVQDEFLQFELAQKGTVHLEELAPTSLHNNIYLWQGDITRLCTGAIVNAANSAMLGCFIPCHACIDNAIHFAAGLQLRQECAELMKAQGFEEPTGSAKITSAYNLPCKYVIHTVGPIIRGKLRKSDCELLKSCYVNCLELAIKNGIESIAFCCVSTGEFCFPNDEAAKIAVGAVFEVLGDSAYAKGNNTAGDGGENNSITSGASIKVIFNVFKDVDYALYKKLL